MPKNRIQLHVLAYDISMDPKRLVEVHRTVRQYGIPLQYSVFLIPGTPARITELLGELESIIDPKRDDIRVYPLPAAVDIVQIGRGADDTGLDLFAGNGHQLPPLIV
ncbi:CRISPR-associated endonuclease Cas2 [uncultured Thiodictyon sp.]|uniref:CRISPR-associated endonuclease Cas2 n=1 Tax=uncultured Thiodictyon sp. TaxID=1846217 RepID=UPI0025DF03C3|nr:CRISPR-associated endonuclease Cas2 [uncultured Thiodictyon sp.]